MLRLSLKINERKCMFIGWFIHAFIILFFCQQDLHAQLNFSKKTFTSDYGLSHNFVQDITEDKTGFLWISTWDGVNRFDGYEFKPYFHKPNDTTTFPFFIVEKTVVDELNNVWVVCPKIKVVKYNRENDNFERFKPSNYNEFIASDIVTGKENDIWLLNQEVNKLYNYKLKTAKLDSFILVNEAGKLQPSFKKIPELIQDNNGNFWITDFLNYNFKIYKGTFTNNSKFCLTEYNISPQNYSETAPDNRKTTVYNIYVDQQNTTWFFTSFGLFYQNENNIEIKLNTSKINPTNFTENLFWSDLNTGLHIIDSGANEILHIKNAPNEYIGSVLIDSNNTIWTGNVNDAFEGIGLNRFIKTPDLITHFLTHKNENGNQNIVVPIIEDKYGDVWAGTTELNYLLKIKADGTISRLRFMKNFKGQKHPKVKSMVQDSSGIWLGCTQNVLVYYDYETSKFTTYFLKDKEGESIENIGLHNILKVENDIIINGFNNNNYKHGVYKFDIDSCFLKMVQPLKFPCLCIHKDGKDGFWLGSLYSTIIHLDRNLKQTAKYKIGDGDNLVEHICLGDSTDIWAALMGGGLVHFEPKSGKTETFTMADGLSSNTVSCILKDKNKILWLSTALGISRFNPVTKQFRNFEKAEGEMIREFNSDSYLQTPNGDMFFGGVGGMISFHPDSVEQKLSFQHSGKLLITDFSVSGISRYFKQAVYEADTVTLNKGDNNFQLTFAKTEFNYPAKIKYRYRLSGADNNWIETDYRHRDISYANLTPGKYKLQVEATNFEDEWTNSTSLLVIIPAFYYQTPFFRFAVALLIVLLIATVIVIYNRDIRISAQQKQAELKLESLRGQMNPHFIFNSLNSINYFISNNDKRSANSYIADFSSLIRNFLGNLSCNYVPLENELKTLDDYLKLEHLRFGDKFDYHIYSDEIENKNDISIFPGMVQPFIENAIWHGVRGLDNRKGQINIIFTKENSEKICCTIEDDGVGRKLAEKYKNKIPGKKSQGIGIVTERLRVINNISETTYSITINDKYPQKKETGTVVKIQIPIKKLEEKECS